MQKKTPFNLYICFLWLYFTALLVQINIQKLYAQNVVLDSLYWVLKDKNIHDTTKLLIQNELAYELRYINADSSLRLAKNIILQAKKINYLKAIIGAEYVTGIHQANASNYMEALKIYFKCLENLEKVHDLKQKAKTLNNIGIVYYFQRKYDRADEFLKQALQINEQIKNYPEVARCYNNLGRIHFEQKHYQKSLEYAKKTLETVDKFQIKGDLSVYFCNVAEYSLYIYQDDTAEQYAFKALDFAKKTNNKRIVIRANIILCAVYIDEEKVEKSTNFLQIAGDLLQKNTFAEEELLYLENAYKLAEKKKDFNKSFLFFKKYIALRDSTQSLKNYKIALQQDFEYNNKLKEQQRKIERENEFMMRAVLFGGLVLLLAFVGFVIRAFYIKSKNLVIISRQKNEIDKQKIIAERTYQQLKDTSDELDKSIMYTSRMQNLLLPTAQNLHGFFEDAFVIFKPKDKVSGDFYWLHEVSPQKCIFVLGDCTGHGVSGAFMTMLSCSLLYAVVHEKEVYSPADILEYLHESIFNILKQENGVNSDGLDMQCCMFEKNENPQDNTLAVTFSGSRSNLYFVENNPITDAPTHHTNEHHILQNHILQKKAGDKRRIGGIGAEEKVSFTNQYFKTNANTTFYFVSDGFYDQNNDHNRKKFGLLYLQELFLKNASLPASQQKEIFLNALTQHQGKAQQRDDITLIGVKVRKGSR